VLAFCLRLFGLLRPGRDWHIECHQFRIEARAEAAGQPTPEGVHRDGVDCVLVLLVDRVNIESGTTTVHALDGTQLGSFTLAAPLDAALVDDTRVKHGVTAVRPLDPAPSRLPRRARGHAARLYNSAMSDDADRPRSCATATCGRWSTPSPSPATTTRPTACCCSRTAASTTTRRSSTG
jgi:hypothetical protein